VGDGIELAIHRALPGLQAWTSPIVIPRAAHAHMVIDGTSGRFHGRIYIAYETSIPPDPKSGQSQGALGLITSEDGGVTFSAPLILPLHGKPMPAGLAVLADGSVIITYHESHPDGKGEAIRAVRSNDGGASLVPIGTVYSAKSDAERISYSSSRPAVDLTNGVYRNRIYVSWNANTLGRWQVFLSSSGDEGKTWSNPVAVSDDIAWNSEDGAGPNNIQSQTAVNRNGIVGVVWYDRRRVPPSQQDASRPALGGWDVRFSASMDGGKKWITSVLISDSPKQFEDGAWTLSSRIMDDPGDSGADVTKTLSVDAIEWLSGAHSVALTADAEGIFHAAWVGNKTGIHQIWTAPIKIPESISKETLGGSEKLIDVTSNVSLKVFRMGSDRRNGSLTVHAKLENCSMYDVYHLLRLVAVEATSDIGTLDFLNPDSRDGNQQPFWDFLALDTPGYIGRNSESRERQLEFRSFGIHPHAISRTTTNGNLLRLKFKVFAPGNKPPRICHAPNG
jgi:hypothetical protein